MFEKLLQRLRKFFKESWEGLQESSIHTAGWVDGCTDFEIALEIRAHRDKKEKEKLN